MTMTQTEKQPNDLPKLAAPAQRALAEAGIAHLEQLSKITLAALKQLHGIGPNAVEQLRQALAAKGLAFADEPRDSAAKGTYAAVNGLRLYYEIHGHGEPLVLIHGGLGMVELLGDILTALAKERQVIAVDLQGHGRTADSDRPLRYESMGDDIAALIRHLGFAQADVMGYSLGGGTALRTAIQHPDLVRRLVIVSVPFKRTGSYPEVLAAMDQMSGAAAEFMKGSPIYQHYVQIAPKPEHFPALLDKLGVLLRQPYDWSDEVAALPMPVMLVFADADSVPTSHIAAFYGLLGGGQRDAGWDGAHLPKSQLAILPGLSHYNIFASPLLAAVVTPFLATALPTQ